MGTFSLLAVGIVLLQYLQHLPGARAVTSGAPGALSPRLSSPVLCITAVLGYTGKAGGGGLREGPDLEAWHASTSSLSLHTSSSALISAQREVGSGKRWSCLQAATSLSMLPPLGLEYLILGFVTLAAPSLSVNGDSYFCCHHSQLGMGMLRTP